MCGIHAIISRGGHPEPLDTVSEEVLCQLRCRGPDHLGRLAVRHDEVLPISFTSTVLSLRGNHVTKQPFLHDGSGSVLCWNGEAWKLGHRDVDGNDGAAVFSLLVHADQSEEPTEERRQLVLEVLRSIQGPFAFIYLDRPAGTLFFGRDRLGRRSLLISDDGQRGRITLSSVAEEAAAEDAHWKEVEADGIYSLDLRRATTGEASHCRSISRHDWVASGAEEQELVSSIGPFNMATPLAISKLDGSSPSVPQLRDRLVESLRLRVLNIPEPPAAAVPDCDVRLAILFSGGLDCTVLARMCHDILPSTQGVDLLNVAFENPRIASQLQKQADGPAVNIYEACPDRITGRKSFAELRRACPGRVWRFFEINIPYAETVSHRSAVVRLMYPHNTEMDLSIAYALYFAARGEGLCHTDEDPDPAPRATTPARVLLSGLGADELFGGYARHGVAFTRDGYSGLAQELRLDVSRLGKRNLGRDDRVMAHWGREVRFPYLDEGLVRWAMGCPSWEKCDFANQESDEMPLEPGKRVLRLLAAELGMVEVAKEKKRAIQFGSRTAKMESGKVKGTMLIS